MNFRNMALAGAVAVGTMVASAAMPTLADDNYTPNYIPRGHAYGPVEDYLPPLNSKRDRINAQADIREAEIQRSNRETRILFEQMRRQDNLDFFKPGRSYSPY